MGDECLGARAPGRKRAAGSRCHRNPSKQIRMDDQTRYEEECSVEDDGLTAPYLQHWLGHQPPGKGFGAPAERRAYFIGMQKMCESALYSSSGTKPGVHQASTLLDLMTIRAFHSMSLRRWSLGTALGFRTRGGQLTDIPAILVFVNRKVNAAWLDERQVLPYTVEGPGALWCDVDVVEFAYFGQQTGPQPEQTYTELVERFRGLDPHIGPGTQVASKGTFGTLGAIVRSQCGKKQVGFLTNRHVAVDLENPKQKIFHPLPPNVGPGVCLGAVERATSFVKDDLWYGVFAGMNLETYVRADGAFVPFDESFDKAYITTLLRGVGPMGEVERVDLQQSVGTVIGRQVVKLGRSSGCTTGRIAAYAMEYNDEKGVCFFTDFLVVGEGENREMFDMEGDSGSLILFTGSDKTEKPRPVGLIWGGTSNRGRLRLKEENGPVNWTSGVDVGRLLDVLQLDIITSDGMLQEAILAQELAMAMPKKMPSRHHEELGAEIGLDLGAGGASQDVAAQELPMPMPKKIPSRLHEESSAEIGLDLGAGGASQDIAAAKEPMVFSILKGNTSAASADLAERELCLEFSGELGRLCGGALACIG